MALFDLILQDLNKKITDNLLPEVAPDQFGSEEDAYDAGVSDAREAAEEYLREIFPQD